MTARRQRPRPAARRRRNDAPPPPARAEVLPKSAILRAGGATGRAGVVWKRDVAVEPAGIARDGFFAGRGLPNHDAANGSDPLLAVAAGAWRAMMDHARSAPVEVGGLLVGEVFRDEDGRLLIDAAVAIPALGALQEAAYFRLTEAAWEHISRERAALHPDLLTVGWYHTHPRLGVFFSGTDRASQRAFFNRPWNVGLVIDPARDEVALFRGEHSERLAPAHLVVYGNEAASRLAGGRVADGFAANRRRGVHDWGAGSPDSFGAVDAARFADAAIGSELAPAEPASAPGSAPAPAPLQSADATANPGAAGAGDAIAIPVAHPVRDRPAGRRPAPIAIPWAPLAALAGATVSIGFAVRAGMRGWRGRR